MELYNVVSSAYLKNQKQIARKWKIINVHACKLKNRRGPNIEP